MKSLLLRAVIPVMLAVAPLAAQQDSTITITSGGIQRTFDIHLPMTPLPQNLPVLVCYHGTGGTGAGMRAVTGLDILSDQHGFIVVYPQAVTIGSDVQWNVYVDGAPGHGGIGVADAPDDVEFTRDLISHLAVTYGADRARVFATGLSNGGFMCYALSMLGANDIQAIAPVAASMWAENNFLNQLVSSGTVRPMPVMHVHGTADAVVDYPDPDNIPKDYEEYPLFIPSRACGTVTYNLVVPIMAGVDKLVFCVPTIEVSLVRIQGMGHAWTNGAYPTSAEIVKFFGLNSATGTAPGTTDARITRIVPNPAEHVIGFEMDRAGRVEICSLSGAVVYSADHGEGHVDVPCDRFPSGSYTIRVTPDKAGEIWTSQIMIAR